MFIYKANFFIQKKFDRILILSNFYIFIVTQYSNEFTKCSLKQNPEDKHG